VVQQARNVSWFLAERSPPAKFLVRDRDSKFTAGFDEVFRSEAMRVVRTPVRSPRANAFAERFVGTVRRECLDRLLIFHQRQLESVLGEFVSHYNSHRPHRALAQQAPLESERTPPRLIKHPDATQARRTTVVGGLIHEYRLVA
jgi:transposase InsO family protein